MATTYKLRTDAEMTERPPQGFAVLFWGYDTGLADGTPSLRILMPDGTFSQISGGGGGVPAELTAQVETNKQNIASLQTSKADATALANYTTTADLQRDYATKAELPQVPENITTQGNEFNSGNLLVKLVNGKIPPELYDVGGGVDLSEYLKKTEANTTYATKAEIADVTKQGNTFNTAGKLVQLNDQGKIPETLYNQGGGGGGELPADVTRQGNEFNIANKLVKLDAQAKIPAELYDQPDISLLATKAELGDINAILDAINGEVI